MPVCESHFIDAMELWPGYGVSAKAVFLEDCYLCRLMRKSGVTWNRARWILKPAVNLNWAMADTV